MISFIQGFSSNLQKLWFLTAELNSGQPNDNFRTNSAETLKFFHAMSIQTLDKLSYGRKKNFETERELYQGS